MAGKVFAEWHFRVTFDVGLSDLLRDTNFKFAVFLIQVQQTIDTVIFFKNKLHTFDKQQRENGKNLAHLRYQLGVNIKCDIENI